ncbi:MAG: hypothetical protein ABI806_28915, partial [Candidatus Solibacter sp.]
AVVKRYCSTPVAGLTYFALLTSPWLARALMWDHPDATGLPFLSAAICLVLLDRAPSWRRDVAAGCCASMAFNSNAFTGEVLAVFAVVYAVLGLAYGVGWRTLLQRGAMAVGGFLAVMAGGSLYYWMVFGEPRNLLGPTLEVANWLAAGASKNWHIEGTDWLWIRFHVFIPILIALVCALLVVRRGMRFEAAVVVLAGAGVSGLYWYRQYWLGANFLQLIFYTSYSIPCCFLMLAWSWQALWDRSAAMARRFTIAAGAAAVIPWVLITWGITWIEDVDVRIWMAMAALTLLATLVAMAAPAGWRGPVAVVAAMLLAISVDAGLAGSRLTADRKQMAYSMVRPFSSPRDTEWDTYRLSLQFIKVVPKLRERPGMLRFWYTGDGNHPFNVVQSTYLWGHSKMNQTLPADPGMPHIGEFQLTLLRDPALRYVGMLGQSPGQVQEGLAALSAAHVGYRLVDARELVSGALHLHWRLIEITAHPPAAGS